MLFKILENRHFELCPSTPPKKKKKNLSHVKFPVVRNMVETIFKDKRQSLKGHPFISRSSRPLCIITLCCSRCYGFPMMHSDVLRRL